MNRPDYTTEELMNAPLTFATNQIGLPHIAIQRQIKLGLAAGQWINLATFKSARLAEIYFHKKRNQGDRIRIAYREQGHGFTCL